MLLVKKGKKFEKSFEIHNKNNNEKQYYRNVSEKEKKKKRK